MSIAENKHRLIDILVVDDEEDHVRLIIKTLQSAGKLINKLITAINGQEAIDYLFRSGKYTNSDHRLPGLILLDIKMPLKNGYEVLEEIKNDNNLKNIPVVMLSSACEPDDINKALELGAVDYIKKSAGFDGLRKKVSLFGYSWGLFGNE